jgi:hypothetical protein
VCAQFGADPIGVWSNPIGDWVEDKDDMELRNTYMYGLDVMFHRCALRVRSWLMARVPGVDRGSNRRHIVGDRQMSLCSQSFLHCTSGAMHAALRQWCPGS